MARTRYSGNVVLWCAASCAANAFVIERASGLAVPGRPVGLADLGARMRTGDRQLAAMVDQLVEDAIATAAERHRRVDPGAGSPSSSR